MLGVPYLRFTEFAVCESLLQQFALMNVLFHASARAGQNTPGSAFPFFAN